ncbi:YheC/YheD family protein [Paenibacillaceae bacterium WGS1546]|uniref:YheC/YheD family protein n=1 Tax=Cohnella sp. WGS1546 TaxID=3366810 RepID=UPI00372D57F9
MGGRTSISSKWTKTRVMAVSAKLAAHIPETRRMSKESLGRLLGRYGMVYVKPDRGSLGVGVMKIARSGRRWTVKAGFKRKGFSSYAAMYGWLRSATKGRAYLAQRGIRMIGLRGRAADFRVMIQKGRKTGWRVTGTAARVAHPGKAVTNGSQGGSIHNAGALLRRTFGKRKAGALQRKFRLLAHRTAGRFSKAYPRMNELGLDIAVDRRGRAWILEVNTRPDPCPFTKLANRSMLRTILRFARGYGRSYNLKCMKARRGGGA